MAAYQKQRRPITGNILKLLSHSIASHVSSEYEQSLLWSVCLVAFWGSFRISELLCEFRHKFNSKSSLMPSDLRFEGDSVGIWLRSEKVANPFGNVVEVWKLDYPHELDPVVALHGFFRRRTERFGSDDNLPFFIHEDGSNLSKSQFNQNLKFLLDQHPEVSGSSRDFWAGHSFRHNDMLSFN